MAQPEFFASLKLEPSETAVLHAASRIYAAFVASGQVTADTRDALCLEAIHTAVRMAQKVDEAVHSDDESW